MEKIRRKIDRERRKRESEIDQERQEREKEMRRMREKDEQNEREIADLRNKLSQASLMTPTQVNHITRSFFLPYHETQF